MNEKTFDTIYWIIIILVYGIILSKSDLIELIKDVKAVENNVGNRCSTSIRFGLGNRLVFSVIEKPFDVFLGLSIRDWNMPKGDEGYIELRVGDEKGWKEWVVPVKQVGSSSIYGLINWDFMKELVQGQELTIIGDNVKYSLNLNNSREEINGMEKCAKESYSLIN